MKKSDFSVFLNDSTETYYWLGFIFADGYFNKLHSSITLAQSIKDYAHMQKYSEFIKYKDKLKIKTVDTNYKKDAKFVRLICANKELFHQLINKFGINFNKTENPPTNLKNITDHNLLLSLIIGFIDGDGSIQKVKGNKLNIKIEVHKSWFDILEFFENFIYSYFNWNKWCNNKLTKINKKGFAKLILADKNLLIKIKNKAKELQIPLMERKWSIIDEFNTTGRTRCNPLNRLVLINELNRLNKSKFEICKELQMCWTTLNRYIKHNNVKILNEEPIPFKFNVINSKNELTTITALPRFCRQNRLNENSFYNLLTGNIKEYNNWKLSNEN